MSDAWIIAPSLSSRERVEYNDTARWIATLSDGSTAVEHSGEYQIIEGERKPWVRLCTFLTENGLHLTSLRLNFRGRTIHMPRAKFERFGISEGQALVPERYSLLYHAELDDLLGDREDRLYVRLTAHYPEFEVHYIQDVKEGNNSWVVVTASGEEPLAGTPRWDDSNGSG